MSFSPSKRILAIAFEEGLWLCQLEAGAVRQIAELPLVGITNLAFCLDGEKLVVSDSQSKIQSFQVEPWKPLFSFETLFPHNGTLRVSLDGKFALLGNTGGSVWLFSLTEGDAIWGYCAADAVFLSDQRIATLGHEGELTGLQVPRD